MKIDSRELIIVDGDAVCGAKPFGGDRAHERAVNHCWEVDLDPSYDGLFCCYCGASARLRQGPAHA